MRCRFCHKELQKWEHGGICSGCKTARQALLDVGRKIRAATKCVWSCFASREVGVDVEDSGFHEFEDLDSFLGQWSEGRTIQVSGVYEYSGETNVTFLISGDGLVHVSSDYGEIRGCRFCFQGGHTEGGKMVKIDAGPFQILGSVFEGGMKRSAFAVSGDCALTQVFISQCVCSDESDAIIVQDCGETLEYRDVEISSCHSEGALLLASGTLQLSQSGVEHCKAGRLLLGAGGIVGDCRIQMCRTIGGTILFAKSISLENTLIRNCVANQFVFAMEEMRCSDVLLSENISCEGPFLLSGGPLSVICCRFKDSVVNSCVAMSEGKLYVSDTSLAHVKAAHESFIASSREIVYTYAESYDLRLEDSDLVHPFKPQIFLDDLPEMDYPFWTDLLGYNGGI